MSTAGLFWIASYPKSGNTWVRCLIASLENGGAAPDLDALARHSPRSADRHWVESVTGVATSDLTLAELAALRASAHLSAAAGDPLAQLAAPGLRYVKIHDRYDPALFPAAATAGAVYVVRDPRDVAPSLADQMQLTLNAAIGGMGQEDAALGRSVRRLHPTVEERLGGWSKHVASWLDEFRGRRLLLRYEDLLARPEAEVTRLADFLGLAAAPETVRAAVATCRFAALSAAEDRNGFVERMDHQPRFFRRGRSGAWRNDLSPAQAAAMVAGHGPMMARLGYPLTS